MMARILLVEDEPGLVMILTDLLTPEGYTVETASDGKTGLAKALAGSFDLILLDVMLPQMNGLDVCKELRQRGRDVAILMLTAKTQLVDRVVGLKLGADDYQTKPFEPPELLARIEALLRRANKGTLVPIARFQFGSVDADFEKGCVERDGLRVNLAAKEMELLRFLIDRRGRVVSREELLEGVWQYQPGVSSRTIDVHVAWLRQKLEEDPELPRYIKTVRGVGYRFAP
jgi:two-component system alkaline phosphatase synthesis response regulator PhoP